ncbi:MAG: hypothetical protein F6K26_19295 [Moorea sp. SIO2I5]|nr:hypothetical protein [Moorena sp. SIO2I5]
MINYLRLVVVSLLAAVTLFLGNANALAADEAPTIVAAWAHSNNGSGPSLVTNIGEKGNVFSGTLIARSATYAWDTVLDVYTDKSRKLWLDVEGSDTSAEVVRTSDVSYKLTNASDVMLGTITFDPETGDFEIDGSGAGWFQGTLMGIYTAHH